MKNESISKINLGYQYYTYFGKLERVIDGDTLEIEVALGFDLKIKKRFRLIDVNCPEMRGEYSDYGKICKQRVERAFEEHDKVIRICTYKPDSFGRWLATVDLKPIGAHWILGESLGDLLTQEESLGYTSLIYDILIEEGYGVIWDGRFKVSEPWKDWPKYPYRIPDKKEK